MAHQLTYLIAPNFHFIPHTGSIRLGSLLADPCRPHRVLTTIEPSELPDKYPNVEKVFECNHEVTRRGSRDISEALWAKFLDTASGKISGQHGVESLKEYTIDELQTEYFRFDPDMEVLQARVAHQKVQAYMKGSFGRKKPVYMIDGVKIAKGLVAKHEKSDKASVEMSGSGTVPTPAGNVEAGANLSASQKTSERDVSNLGMDVVFAYKLLIVEYEGWRGNGLKINEYRPKAGFQGTAKRGEGRAEGDESKLALRPAIGAELSNAGENISVSTMKLDNGDEICMVSFPEKI